MRDGGRDVHSVILREGHPQPRPSQNLATTMRAAADMLEPSLEEGCHRLWEIKDLLAATATQLPDASSTQS